MADPRRRAVKRSTEGENLARSISLPGKLEQRPQEIGASYFVRKPGRQLAGDGRKSNRAVEDRFENLAAFLSDNARVLIKAGAQASQGLQKHWHLNVKGKDATVNATLNATAAPDGKRAREGDRGAAQPDHGDSEG